MVEAAEGVKANKRCGKGGKGNNALRLEVCMVK